MNSFKRRIISLGLCISLLGVHTPTRSTDVDRAFSVAAKEAAVNFISNTAITLICGLLITKIFLYIINVSTVHTWENVNKKRKSPIVTTDGTIKLEGYGSTNLPKEVVNIARQLNNPEHYAQFGAKPVNSMLFYGPSGTGKTHLARCLADMIGCPFLPVKATELLATFVGQGSQKVRDLFSQAKALAISASLKSRFFSKKEDNEPQWVVIFIDEIDALGNRSSPSPYDSPKSFESLNALLTEMDGFEKRSDIHVIVMAATNKMESMDSALLNRFGQRRIEVPCPDQEARQAIAEIYIPKYPKIDTNNITAAKIACLTEGLVARTMEKLFEDAALNAASRTYSFSNPSDELIDPDDFAHAIINSTKNNGATDEEKRKVAEEYSGGSAFFPFNTEKLVAGSKGMPLKQFKGIFVQAYHENHRYNLNGAKVPVTADALYKMLQTEQEEFEQGCLSKKLTVYTTLYPCGQDVKVSSLIKNFKNKTQQEMGTVFKSAYATAKKEQRGIAAKDLQTQALTI